MRVLKLLLVAGAFASGASDDAAEALVAALRPLVEAPASASALLKRRKPTWAVVFAGEARSFVRISERVADRLVARLDAVGGADCYFVMDVAAAPATSIARWAAAFDGFGVLALRQSRAPLADKRRAARALWEATEHTAGAAYDFVLTTRPDVDHLRSVDAAALAATAKANLVDVIGHVARNASVDATWPTPHASVAGGQGGYWHVRLARASATQTSREWYLHAPLAEARAVARSPAAFDRDRAVGAVARACRRYDAYVVAAAREAGALATEWSEPSFDALFDAPRGGWADTPDTSAFRVWAARDDRSFAAAVRAFAVDLEAAVNRSRASAVARDAPVAIPALEAACRPPRVLCGADAAVLGLCWG